VRVEFNSELSFENVLHVHRGVCCRVRVSQYVALCCKYVAAQQRAILILTDLRCESVLLTSGEFLECAQRHLLQITAMSINALVERQHSG